MLRHVIHNLDVIACNRQAARFSVHHIFFYTTGSLQPHSITSSARARSEAGIVRPSVLAVLRLNAISNLVGSSTGISPTSVPRKILSTKSAARRYKSAKLGPYDIKPPPLTCSRAL